MKGRGGGTGCGTRVVPVVLSGSFVAVERGETLNTDTQTQESEVNTCNFFVGKETYLDVMFMCIYYIHMCCMSTHSFTASHSWLIPFFCLPCRFDPLPIGCSSPPNYDSSLELVFDISVEDCWQPNCRSLWVAPVVQLVQQCDH